MKKLLLVTMVAAAAVFLSGCLVTSVYPFYNAGDLVSEPALLGEWHDAKESKNVWHFEKGDGLDCRLTYKDNDKTWTLISRAFRLKGELFLDLFPANPDGEMMPPSIPSHFVLRVLKTGPELQMAALNYDWLDEFLKQNPKALRHHVTLMGAKSDDKRLVLTADTAELQKFLLKHLKTEAAWKDPFSLNKMADSAK